MKYKTICKRLSKWDRLTRVYLKKAKQSDRRNGKGADRLRKLGNTAHRLFNMNISITCMKLANQKG